MQYYLYILANSSNVTIYTGVTNNLFRRLEEHLSHADADSFTARYHVDKLVYYEVFSDPTSAIEREKQIKGWNRKRKNELIETLNPSWSDLLVKLLEEDSDVPV